MDSDSLRWLAFALLLCSVSSQKIPSFKQGYGMKAGVDRAGAIKSEEGDKNVSEKSSPGVEKVKIKIADPPTLSRIPSPHSSTPAKTLVLRTQPASIAYPSHLFSLAGECFITTEKGYRYTVCPFFNVTQKEMGSGWNKFEGVLGVWREWIIENDTIIGMQFVMGDKCGATDREAMVYFNCSTTTSVHTTKEHHTCKYSMWMDTPLACFKGAMQVYQLLSEDQLKRWDGLDQGYYAGELTEQGLKAKRKEILVEANLMYSQELSEHAALPSKEPQKIVSFTASTHTAPVSVEKDSRSLMNSHIPLTHCMEQNSVLRKELKEVKAHLEELLTLIAEFPPVAARYAALKNGSWVPKINHGADTLHSMSSHNGSREVKKNLDQEEAADQQNTRLEDHNSQHWNGLETHSIHQEIDRELGPRGTDKASNARGDDVTGTLPPEGHHEGPSPSADLEQEMQGNMPDNANGPMEQEKDEPLREEGRAHGHEPPLREEERADDLVPLEEVNTVRTGKEEQEGRRQEDHSQSDATNIGVGADSRKENLAGMVHVHGSNEKPVGEHSASKVERHGQQGGGGKVKSDTTSLPTNHIPKPQVAIKQEPEDKHVDKITHGNYSKTTPSPDRNPGRESL